MKSKKRWMRSRFCDFRDPRRNYRPLILLVAGFVCIWAVGAFAEGEAPKGAEKAEAANVEAPKAVEKAGAVETPKVAEGVPAKEDSLFPEKEIYSREEVAAIKKLLEGQSAVVKTDLEQQKEYLAAAKVEIEEDLKKLTDVRKTIESFMGEKDKAEALKIKKLAKYYENMDAEQAAPLLEGVEEKLVISMFDVMDAKKAGMILGLMNKKIAERITEAFPRLKVLQAAK